MESLFGEFVRTIFSIETDSAASINVDIIGWFVNTRKKQRRFL